MGFGQLLDRFWTDFGSILEAKLALKSVQEGIKPDVKKNIKKTSKNRPTWTNIGPPEARLGRPGGRGDPP